VTRPGSWAAGDDIVPAAGGRSTGEWLELVVWPRWSGRGGLAAEPRCHAGSDPDRRAEKLWRGPPGHGGARCAPRPAEPGPR